jgi:hypothetical protein
MEKIPSQERSRQRWQIAGVKARWIARFCNG